MHHSHHQTSPSLVAHNRSTPEEVKAHNALIEYRREQQRRFLLSKQTTIDRVRNLLK